MLENDYLVDLNEFLLKYIIFIKKLLLENILLKTPKLKANKELKEIINWFNKADKESFISLFDEWYSKHKD